ncbi:type I methionyl aminopeptidase [Candidatus Uabimicrobium sp. HlEnr_7]|uniref:type I methionyl aminopeptidase n=1 Tax=Candidatus Uabimicrobium helgolandensis TaxID=3095367 RepID=UPI0035560B0B
MITIKSKREIEIMKKSGRLVAETHALIKSLIEPGIAMEILDQEAENFIRKNDGVPLFKGYRGFPSTICASLNEEIVHGIPDKRKLKEGDILSVDIGVKYRGYVGDSAWTYPVGQISKEAQQLLKICEESLYCGIEAAIPGNKVSVISAAVQKHAEKYGYGIVREYTGHGIGTELHEDPQIPNYVDDSWRSHDDTRLKKGFCIAIEPMLNIGTHKTKVKRRKGWEVVLTKDNSLSAHFEHSVAILEDGPFILTKIDD